MFRVSAVIARVYYMLFHVDAAHTRFHVDVATFENARIVGDGFFLEREISRH